MDEREPSGPETVGAEWHRHLVSEHEHLALVGVMNAGEDLDQGGLATPVGTKEPMNFAGSHREVHAAERRDAAEALDEPFDSEDVRAGGARSGPGRFVAGGGHYLRPQSCS
jgi:hypothetical protein